MAIYPNKCTRCGKCCTAEVCKIGRDIFKTTTAPCPGLRGGKTKSCILVRTALKLPFPQEYQFCAVLGIGMGCDSTFESEVTKHG
jgi:hypothetical protein